MGAIRPPNSGKRSRTQARANADQPPICGGHNPGFIALAKACSTVPSANKAELDAALALARKGVELGKVGMGAQARIAARVFSA
jgi:hypothetical protein